MLKHIHIMEKLEKTLVVFHGREVIKIYQTALFRFTLLNCPLFSGRLSRFYIPRKDKALFSLVIYPMLR